MLANRRRLSAIALLALGVAAAAGCSSSSSTAGGGASTGTGTPAAGSTLAAASKGTLLMEIPLRTNPSNALMAGGFLTECKALGYNCEAVGTIAVDVPGSNALAAAALARGGVKGFADYGFDPETYPYMTQVSQQYKIPIVSWHVPIPPGTVNGLTAITDGNPVVGATEAADAMGAKLDGKGTVAITELSFNSTENDMAQNFKTEMSKKYPSITVLAPQLEGSDPTGAVSKAVSILQGNPNITAAFSTTGGGCTTWTGAQSQANKKLTIVCMDYTPQNLAMVKSGQVFGLVAQPLFQEGERSAEILNEAITHQTVSYNNPLPEGMATLSNISQYQQYINEAIAAGVQGIS
jgi:ribose transport system substrate-binding protein